MNKKHWAGVQVLTVIILAALLLVGCGFQKATSDGGVVSEMTMATGVAKDGRPVGPTNVFPQDAKSFYCSFKISNFPLDTKMTALLIYIGPEVTGTATDNLASGQYAFNYVMSTQSGTMQKRTGYAAIVWPSSSAPGYKWPQGNYKVVLNLSGSTESKEAASVSFKVQ